MIAAMIFSQGAQIQMTIRRKRIIWANQTLRRSEKRIYSAILSLITLLARNIANDASLSALAHVDRWERSAAITLYHIAVETATTFADQVLYYFEAKSIKTFIIETIKRWASVFAPLRSTILANELRKALNQFTIIIGDNPAATLRSTIVTKAVIIRVARDFAHASSERGSYISASSVGLPMMKEWAAMEDHRVRPNHAAANGQLQPIHRPFNVGTSSFMFPGDPSAPISERANCRCTALYYPIINGRIIR